MLATMGAARTVRSDRRGDRSGRLSSLTYAPPGSYERGWAMDSVSLEAASGDWRQHTSMDAFGQLQQVVGESHYRAALGAAIENLRGVAASTGWVTAQLIPEVSNPHDSLAIQVLIDGEVVGYLPRDERDNDGITAQQRWNKVMAMTKKGRPVTTPAVITGRSLADQGLTLFSRCHTEAKHPVTLWGRTSFSLKPRDVDQDVVGGRRRSRTPFPVQIRNHEDRVWIGLDGKWAGSLPLEPWGPVVDDLGAVGLEATCLAWLEREDEGFRLRLHVPDIWRDAGIDRL